VNIKAKNIGLNKLAQKGFGKYIYYNSQYLKVDTRKSSEAHYKFGLFHIQGTFHIAVFPVELNY